MNKELYDNYLTNFKKTLWNKCLENSVFDNIPESEIENIKTIFENTIENHKIQILQNDNNNSMIDILLRTINTEIHSKKLTKKNQFDNALTEKQNEYKELLNNTPPETPNFSDNTQDEPINNENLDALIQEQIKSRELTLPPSKELTNEINNITEENIIVSENNYPLQPPPINMKIESNYSNQNIDLKHFEKLENIEKEITQIKEILHKQNIILEKIVGSQVLLLKNKIK